MFELLCLSEGVESKKFMPESEVHDSDFFSYKLKLNPRAADKFVIKNVIFWQSSSSSDCWHHENAALGGAPCISRSIWLFGVFLVILVESWANTDEMWSSGNARAEYLTCPTCQQSCFGISEATSRASLLLLTDLSSYHYFYPLLSRLTPADTEYNNFPLVLRQLKVLLRIVSSNWNRGRTSRLKGSGCSKKLMTTNQVIIWIPGITLRRDYFEAFQV